MTKRDLNDLELDALFTSARQQEMPVSEDLMARVLQDALTTQAALSAEGAEAPASVAPGWWPSLLSAVGGWPSVAGLATAGVAGLWIGISPPDLLSESAENLLQLDSDLFLVDVAAGYSFDLGEG